MQQFNIKSEVFACFGHYWPSTEGKANITKETLYVYDKYSSYKVISTVITRDKTKIII
jgi:hypothetical protein